MKESYSQQLCRKDIEASWLKGLPLFLRGHDFDRRRRPFLDRTVKKEKVVMRHLEPANVTAIVLQYRKYHFN